MESILPDQVDDFFSVFGNLENYVVKKKERKSTHSFSNPPKNLCVQA